MWASLVSQAALASPVPKEKQGSPASPVPLAVLGPRALKGCPSRGPKGTQAPLAPQGVQGGYGASLSSVAEVAAWVGELCFVTLSSILDFGGSLALGGR